MTRSRSLSKRRSDPAARWPPAQGRGWPAANGCCLVCCQAHAVGHQESLATVRCLVASSGAGQRAGQILQFSQMGPDTRLSLGRTLNWIAAKAAGRPMPLNGCISSAATTISSEQPSLLHSVPRRAGTHGCCASPASRSRQARGRRSIDRLHRWACLRPSDA